MKSERTYTYKETHPRFKLNGIHYKFDELNEIAYSLVKEGAPHERDIGNFLLDWSDKHTTISLKTSGSTGNPKTIVVDKQAMVNSALATQAFFKLRAGQTALLCLPTKYIAGKMMLVRAMMIGLQLDTTEPTSHPVFDDKKVYHFCAMLPMQLQNCYDRCGRIKTIIVGGSRVTSKLELSLQKFTAKVYETYGMTETLTHIAVRPLNTENKSQNFQVLPNIEISTDDRQCLIVEAPHLSNEKIVTNDVVEIISPKSFKWLGRIDNVINSGGLKFYPETIESKLASVIDKRFFITSEEDTNLGERIVLIIEGDAFDTSAIDFSMLDKHETPKAIYFISKFEETKSGKIQRHQTLEVLK